jgi:glutaredoxin
MATPTPSTFARVRGQSALLIALVSCQLLGCGNPTGRLRQQKEGESAQPGSASGPGAGDLEAIKPPFPVQGDLDGLLLVWFDAEGVHSAQKRSEVPEAQRAHVRIDSLAVAPDARLDADHVYVADLRTPGGDGSYPVQKATRTWFDAQVDKAKPQVVAAADTGVVIYKASWCGVCRSAASYLRKRHVDFVEKDVEHDPGASDEMMRKAQAKGLSPHGVPVIDFRGEIMLGFDQGRLESLIERYAKAI